jgi:hypothetical protein
MIHFTTTGEEIDGSAQRFRRTTGGSGAKAVAMATAALVAAQEFVDASMERRPTTVALFCCDGHATSPALIQPQTRHREDGTYRFIARRPAYTVTA